MKFFSKNKLVALLFAIIGLGMVWYGYSSYRQSQESKTWPSVKGKVMTSKATTERDDDGECYEVDIEYLYVVQNKEYRNYDVAWDLADCSESKANEIVKKYPEQSEVEVFYDPSQPSVSALFPGEDSSFLILAIIGGIWTAISSVLFFLIRS